MACAKYVSQTLVALTVFLLRQVWNCTDANKTDINSVRTSQTVNQLKNAEQKQTFWDIEVNCMSLQPWNIGNDLAVNEDCMLFLALKILSL